MDVLLAANISGRPLAGGHRSAIGQWASGLRRLGHRVVVVDTGDSLGSIGEAPSPDVVLDVMGSLRHAGVYPGGTSVFVDIDPGYPQMWRELGLADLLTGHNVYVTVGANVGRDDCRVPTCGLPWIATPPPVDTAAWPVAVGGDAYTSVATWRNAYGTVAFDGATYGSRVHEFRAFLELPGRVEAEFELALDIDPGERPDLDALAAGGWRLVEPATIAGDPGRYRAYIQRSRAEFSVAQNIYVATRSGWLSDRSVAYLASGKPVLAQDTGFSDHYPVGEGLLAYATLDEAAAGIEEIERDYARHCRAARALAERHFDAAVVLERLIERIWAAAGIPVR